jgi:hypothetical protein
MRSARALLAWSLSETARVRAASWAASLALFALALLLAAQRFPNSFAAMGAADLAAIEVAIEARPPEQAKTTPQRAPRRTAFAAPSRAAEQQSAAAVAVRLWSYDAQGRILFANADQYRRCLDARARGREEADCPSAADHAGLALEPGAEDYAALSRL